MADLRFRAVLAAGALLFLGVSACSVSTSTSVSTDQLTEQVDATLQEQKSDKAEVRDLTCDGGLDAEVDATQRCHFVDALDDRYGVTVTVTGVDGHDLSYDTDVDPGQTVEPAELEPELTTQLTDYSGGVKPDDVECPDELPGMVGATTTCILTAGTDRLETTVTVTSATGPDVKFDIAVADEALPPS